MPSEPMTRLSSWLISYWMWKESSDKAARGEAGVSLYYTLKSAPVFPNRLIWKCRFKSDTFQKVPFWQSLHQLGSVLDQDMDQEDLLMVKLSISREEERWLSSVIDHIIKIGIFLFQKKSWCYLINNKTSTPRSRSMRHIETYSIMKQAPINLHSTVAKNNEAVIVSIGGVFSS